MNTKRISHEVPEEDAAQQSPARKLVRKPDMGDIILSADQVRELKEKYNINSMTCEEEDAMLLDLSKMGILTREDCSAFVKSAGSMFDVLSRQISSDINLLYQMAIAGRYSTSHIEHIRSQQKILDVLEQMMAE